MHEFYEAPGSHAVANDTVTIGFLKAQAGFECHDDQCGGPTGKAHPLPYSVCASPLPGADGGDGGDGGGGLGRGPTRHDADNQICTASYIELYRLDGNKVRRPPSLPSIAHMSVAQVRFRVPHVREIDPAAKVRNSRAAMSFVALLPQDPHCEHCRDPGRGDRDDGGQRHGGG